MDIHNPDELLLRFTPHKTADQVSLSAVRNNQTITFALTIAVMPVQ